MTAGASHFVTATSLQAVSGRPVRDSLWDQQAEAAMGHIELARWADLVLVAPATADFLSTLAVGAAHDLLSTLCLATQAPIALAPAMNHVMWSNPAVQANCDLLSQRGIRLLGPDSGEQACGDVGEGRMLQPEAIADAVMGQEKKREQPKSTALQNKTVLITAGPTREALDPVRYISNRSSGKMGFAMAAAAAEAGARVILVSGPVQQATPDGVKRIDIESAEQMFAAVHDQVGEADIFIAAAAVADYRPAEVSPGKIKKNSAEVQVRMVKAPDTLASVAKLANGPFTVGFAAETERLRNHAMSKLEVKKLDMIIANDVSGGRGFDKDDNQVEVFWRTGGRSFPLIAKTELARQLIALIAERYEAGFGSDTATELPIIKTKK
jgi:phosphopantothenoylcysteine decarboxylase/phosphopantothenate--cysteine ligase